MATLASDQFRSLKRYGSFADNDEDDNNNGHGYQKKKEKRSGKELWAILRRRVYRQDFLFVIPCVNRPSFNPSDLVIVAPKICSFRDIDLPYDFTLLDCFLVLLAYLAISVIAYSFVFEQWSVIDSMYFAVVTLTTIGYGVITVPRQRADVSFASFLPLEAWPSWPLPWVWWGTKLSKSQVSSISKAETQFVDDLAKAFRKEMTASQRRMDYAKYGHSDSNESCSGSSFSSLDDVDQVCYSIRRRAREIKSPWHNTMDWWKKFAKMLCTCTCCLNEFLGGQTQPRPYTFFFLTLALHDHDSAEARKGLSVWLRERSFLEVHRTWSQLLN